MLNLVNGGLEALWCNLLWANSRLVISKILLHALKLFGFLVIGFSALALRLLAKPCCWHLAASARAHNCSYLAYCFKGCFRLGAMSQEAKNRWERVGARWQERFLLGPADAWIFRNPHGALDRSSAGLSGNFASYGVNTISGLQAMNFNHFGCGSCRPFLQDV